jgi:succinate dehydrogenase/fumarate reductase flavoprotein subunit
MKTQVLIIGSGLSAYFCKKELQNKAIVISSNKISNSLKSGKKFFVNSNEEQTLKEMITSTGKGINEKEKIDYFCSNVDLIKHLPEFEKQTMWKNFGFVTQFNFLKEFQKSTINGTLEDIIVENNKICGALLKIKGKITKIECKSIILCSGGYNHLFDENDSEKYPPLTPLEIAFNKGAIIKDLEFVFYHPFGNKNNIIPLDNLTDSKIITNGKENLVIQKLLKEKNLHQNLSKIALELAKNQNKTIILNKNNSIEVTPIVHTTLGGLVIDTNCMTNINGLFACGEVMAGMNGADRIGGISLSEAVVFGEKAGKGANEYCEKNEFIKIAQTKSKKQTIAKNSSKIILSKYFKTLKSEEDILNGLKESRKRKNYFCEATFLACLKRKESRGCFFRTNYPNENQNYAKSSAFQLKKDKIVEK